MALNLNKFLSAFLPFALVLFGLHYLVLRALSMLSPLPKGALFSIYGFLTVLSLIHFISIKWLFGKWPKQAGFIFTGMSMFKMMVAVLFLFPFIYPTHPQSIGFALNFMSVYLLFLCFEVVFLVKNMMKNH